MPPLRVDVDLLIAADVQHALDVENVHLPAPTKRRRERCLSTWNVIVQKLIMQGVIRNERAPEQNILHPRERLDVVREQIVHGLIAANFEAAPPSSLDSFVRGRDHEEVIPTRTERHALAQSRRPMGMTRYSLRSE